MDSFYLYERMMQSRVEEEHRQAELRRLQKSVGTGRTSWLVQQRNRALSRLGRLLTLSGQRLILSTAPPRSAEGA